MSLRLRVTYGRTTDFLTDVDQQVSRRGLLVRADVGDVERGVAVELEIVTPVGRAMVTASVLQPMPGIGVAVELDPAAFTALADAARSAPVGSGEPPVHEHVVGSFAPVGDEEEEPTAARTQRTVSETAERAQQQAKGIQTALHGDKNQRMAIMRDQNKLLHNYVLKNPQLGVDEVVAIAKMATVSADMLQQIGARRDWAERAEVASALVRNPKTPIPLAIRLLDFVNATELRALAKAGVREAIQRVARKKVLG